MKTLKKISAFLVALMLCVGLSAAPFYAASSTQDGLSVDFTTDKASYEKGDKIDVTFKVTNANDFAVSNVVLKVNAPEGYGIVDGSVSEKTIASLAAGANESITISYSEAGSGQPGDNPDTGDHNGPLILGYILLLAAGVVVLVVGVKKGKTKALAIGLCFVTVLGTIGGTVTTLADTTTETRTITVSETVTVDGVEKAITATVQYDWVVEDEEDDDDDVVVEEVTREEWVVALMEGIGVAAPTDGQYSFDDIDEADNAGLIEMAIRLGYVTVEANADNMVYFHPDAAATREFVAVTLSKALGITAIENVSLSWDDAENITYAAAAKLTVDEGIFALVDNSFVGNKKVTDAELAKAKEVIEEYVGSTDIDDEITGDVEYSEDVEVTDVEFELDEDSNTVIVEDVSAFEEDAVYVLEGEDGEAAIAIKVVSVDEETGAIVYEQPELYEVVDSFDVVGSTVTGGTVTAGEGVTLTDVETHQSVTGPVGDAENGTIPLFGTKEFTLNIGGKEIEGTIDLEELEYRFVANPKLTAPWINIDEVYIALNSSFSVDVDLREFGNGIEKKVKICDFNCPVGYGFNASGEVFFILDAEAGISTAIEIDSKTGIQYLDGSGIRPIFDIDPSLAPVALEGGAEAGFQAEPGAEFLGIDLVSVYAKTGLGLEGELTNIGVDEEDFGAEFCIDVTSYLFLSIGAKVGPDILNLEIEQDIMDADASIYRENFHLEETGEVEECTRGAGDYQGYVKTATDHVAIQRAKVQVLNSAGDIVDTTLTDANGKFTGLRLTAGRYTLRVSAEGYVPVEQSFEIIGGQTTYIETQYMVAREEEEEETSYTCSGNITDAYTGYGLAGVTIEVTSADLNSTGEVLATAITDEAGDYSFTAEAGKYALKISKEEYVTITKYITLTADKNDAHYSLSPTNLPEVTDNLRVVLRWGETPRDLDSHMVGPEGEGRFHVYYADKVSDSGYVDLDVDDTTSYGPETVTVSQTESGVYSYYVHDYTNRNSTESTALANSGAYIELYSGNVLLYTIHIPEGEYGTLWHVFDYDSDTGLVTLVNEFTYESYPGNVGANGATIDANSSVITDKDILYGEGRIRY